MKARAIVFTGANQVELQTVELPEPEASEVLIQAEATCISPGTELRCLAGLQPDYEFPSIPGYSFVGRVQIGNGHLREGIRVFCRGTEKASVTRGWGGHVSHAVTSPGSCFAVPEGVSAADAGMAALAAIAFRGVRVTKPLPGTSVAVIGLGPIGQLSSRLFQIAGAKVCAFDVDASRVAIASNAEVPARAVNGSLSETVRAHFGGGAHIVVDATGSPKVLRESLLAVRDVPWTEPHETPALVVQGSYPAEFSLDYQTAFLKELRLLFPRSALSADFEVALQLIGSGRLQVHDLVCEVVPVSRAAEIYSRLQHGDGPTFVFEW